MYRKKKNEKDINFILKRLRKEDAHECLIQRGKHDRKDIIKDTMTSNQYVVVACEKTTNTPVLMGGATCVSDGVAVVWLLTTPKVVKHQICLLRELKKEIEKFDEKYWLTFNTIYKENRIAKKWLKKYGYRFPNDEEEKTLTDKCLLKQIPAPEGFELFYRIRKPRGLK